LFEIHFHQAKAFDGSLIKNWFF